MRENFGRSLQLVLKHEGGYVDHPQDPGGATNKGITLATFRGYFGNNRLTKDDLRNITEETVAKIYRERYWNAVKGDQLPLGLDYAVFDFGVNSGPSRAVKFLQRAVGTAADGVIGPQTMLAVNGFGARQAIVSLCAARLTWLQTVKDKNGKLAWPTFGRGWGRRVAEVEDAALAMVGIRQPAPSSPPLRPSQPIADDDEMGDAIRGPEARKRWAIIQFFLDLFSGRLFARLKGSGR